MTKTFAGKIGKALSVLVASALLLVSALMLSACSGRYPEISMRISFNGEEYTLNYILYRNYYQQTVDHYMELIDMDYFDGTVISDYQSDRMVAGGYRYEGENTDELIALDYEAATKDADGNVTLENITVWKDAERTQPTNRLHGETSSNGFSIEDGSGLTNQVGALGAYTYVSSSMQATQRMHYKYSSSDNYGESEYYKNSFTACSTCIRAATTLPRATTAYSASSPTKTPKPPSTTCSKRSALIQRTTTSTPLPKRRKTSSSKTSSSTAAPTTSILKSPFPPSSSKRCG